MKCYLCNHIFDETVENHICPNPEYVQRKEEMLEELFRLEDEVGEFTEEDELQLICESFEQFMKF